MVMKKTVLGGLLLVALASACGPRLKRADDASSGTASALPEVPVAKMSVKYEDSKLDAEHKYTEDGQFTVSGLFYKDDQPTDATVKVALQKSDAGLSRAYTIDVAALQGAAAKVEMWDDGFLTVVIPDTEAPKPGFQTSNQNVKAVSLEQPGQAASTCYFGKEILDGKIRFALCDLQTETPRIAFVDAVPEAAPAAGAPAAEPAAEPAQPAN
jgi:hypothetical protein